MSFSRRIRLLCCKSGINCRIINKYSSILIALSSPIFISEPLSAQDVLEICPSDVSLNWHKCYGKIKFDSGSEYSGYWINNEMNVYGVYKFNDGDVYTGEFLNGKFHGFGKFVSKRGYTYAGDFKDSKYNGWGMVSVVGGQKTIGEFKDDKEDGSFTIYYPDGGQFIGKMIDGSATEGIRIYPNGDRYEGQFAKDMFNGEGVYTYKDGTQMKGVFKDHKFVNQGEELDQTAKYGHSTVPMCGDQIVRTTISDSLDKELSTLAKANPQIERFEKMIENYRSLDYDRENNIRTCSIDIRIRPIYSESGFFGDFRKGLGEMQGKQELPPELRDMFSALGQSMTPEEMGFNQRYTVSFTDDGIVYVEFIEEAAE